MSHRTGATLVEVLVAIFVMALGLLGLLALFPLGALSMAQAIKDSRTTQAAANAFAVAQALGIRNDRDVVMEPRQVPGPDFGVPEDIFVMELRNPRDDSDRRPPIVDRHGPSYPVFVDPIGAASGSDAHLRSPPGRSRKQGIPRRSVSVVKNAPDVRRLATAVQWFTSLDDITFQKEGTGLASLPLRREGRYSCAYLLRRPRSSDSSVVDLSVVVFSGRPTAPGLGENAYGSVAFDSASNVVRVKWDSSSQEKPAVRAGGWILDATMIDLQGKPDPHGFFYRVVNVVEGAESGQPYVDLELQSNPKLSTSTRGSDDDSGQAESKKWGVLVVLDGVAEVFEKGPGWRP